MFSLFKKNTGDKSFTDYEQLLNEQTDAYNKFYTSVKMCVYAFIKSVDADKAAMLMATGKLELYTVSDMFTVLSEGIRDLKQRVEIAEDELELERERCERWQMIADESCAELTKLKNNQQDKFLEK